MTHLKVNILLTSMDTVVDTLIKTRLGRPRNCGSVPGKSFRIDLGHT